MIPIRPRFVAVAPRAVAARLDLASVHLWRIRRDPAAGRAPLRALLSAYLDIPAAAIELRTGVGGKPQLAADKCSAATRPQLDFNWSHSGGFALVAIARGQPLGVDIEHLARNPQVMELARRFFHPDEAAALAALAPRARKRAFLAVWCAKEAVLKAAGTGLSFGLARLAFEPAGDGDWRLTGMDPELGPAGAWQLAGFRAAPDYRGALAWRGPARTVHAFTRAGQPT